MSRRGRRKNKGSLFKRFLGFLVLSCMLTALLSALIICLTSADAYATRIAREMAPRAHVISRLVARYQTGQLSYDSLLDIAVREQQGADIFIIDGSGILRISSQGLGDGAFKMDGTLAEHASDVLLSGESAIWIDWQSANGIVVGAPVTDNMQRVTGAILMTKQTKDVFSSMSGLLLIFFLSSLLASALMIVPAYFVSRRMSGPIQHMTAISMQMAAGDFSARADERADGEVGQLGCALNHLSQRLHTNIQDLTLARNRFHVILEGLHEGVIAFDAGAEIVYSNGAALRLFGCGGAEELGERVPALKALCAEVIESGAVRRRIETLGERKLLCVLSCSQETSE
ncbi:MAG: HAMP domain-containing protein, partial [Clostridia bacterium]|nr:HAMP domain-containing protein [Clostridia bacterium]